jgi:hypothetical protein
MVIEYVRSTIESNGAAESEPADRQASAVLGRGLDPAPNRPISTIDLRGGDAILPAIED